MATQQTFRIVGTGGYLPQRRLSAEDIDKRLNVAPGWTQANVGVLTRFECASPETLVTMGVQAIRNAMADAQVTWKEIDCIIDCSTSQYRLMPCNAAHYQQAIGAEAAGIPCFDIQTTCLGSLVGLQIVNAMMLTHMYQNILLVTSESALAGVNWQQPESAALIGDGAGALVLSRAEMAAPIFFCHETFAEHLELCRVDGGGHRQPADEYTSERHHEFRFSMDGPRVFRVAIKQLLPMVRNIIEQWQTHHASNSPEQLQVVPHQASPKALELVRQGLSISSNRFHVAVQDFGNMAAASIPWMLHYLRQSGAIRTGDTLLLMGTSAGYSQAAMILEL